MRLIVTPKGLENSWGLQSPAGSSTGDGAELVRGLWGGGQHAAPSPWGSTAPRRAAHPWAQSNPMLPGSQDCQDVIKYTYDIN